MPRDGPRRAGAARSGRQRVGVIMAAPPALLPHPRTAAPPAHRQRCRMRTAVRQENAMVHVRRSFTVERPLPAVAAYIADFAHAVDWDPGTRECVRDGDDAEPAVGARWRNVSVFRGRRTELDYRLDRREERRVTFTGTNKTATSTDDFGFEETGRGRASPTTRPSGSTAWRGWPIPSCARSSSASATRSPVRCRTPYARRSPAERPGRPGRTIRPAGLPRVSFRRRSSRRRLTGGPARRCSGPRRAGRDC